MRWKDGSMIKSKHVNSKKEKIIKAFESIIILLNTDKIITTIISIIYIFIHTNKG